MTRVINFFSPFFFIFLLGFIHVTFCQKPASKKLTLRDTTNELQIQPAYDFFTFTKINSIPYYFNKNDRDKIENSYQAKKWDQLYGLLNDYIANFGIENFERDNQLLWYYAQLTEAKGDTATAKSMYKLVLKHYRKGNTFDEAKSKLDSINDIRQEDYVPLKYYYELVEFRKSVDTLRPPRGVLLNMGVAINSKDGDYGPTLGYNNQLMLFTSKRNKIKRGLEVLSNEDIFLSNGDARNVWSDAQPLTEINTQYNEGSASMSHDGNTIFFARCNSPDSNGSCDLFVTSKLPDSAWSKPQNLGAQVNSVYWDSHPSLSHTGDTLFFASDRIGGFGLSDIYFTCKNEKGTWMPPQNAGPVINTRGNEVSPFYHPVHDILYFSSDGHLLNFGEFDIYKTYWKQNRWYDPLNIGPLVNGTGSEFYFTIDSQSKNLYYARSEEDKMGNLDLFSFPLPMEAQPDATTSLRGSLLDVDSGKPFSKGIVSIIDLDNGIEVSPKFLRPDGSFAFQLINNNNYLLIIQGDEFFRLEEIFFLEGETEIHRKVASISSRIKFESLNFDNGKSDLKPEMFRDLDKLINFLLDNPDINLSIEGHTDSDGNPESNLQLSQKRADAIKEYIVVFGNIDDTRVMAKGYGSSKPIVKETQEADKKLNRRVEFNIYNKNNEKIE